MRFRAEPVLASDHPWEIQTFAYSYLLYRDDREIIAYHRDLEAAGAGAVRTPHLHLGKDLSHPGLPQEDRDRIAVLAAAHLPTGLVPFTEILRTAIRDFGVKAMRRQGESVDDAQTGAERSFVEAEAAMRASFV